LVGSSSGWDRLTGHFSVVHKALSREDFPLSAYPLLVQALRNEINKGFETDDFDVMLGEGASAAVAAMIRERFNMDGFDIAAGLKVGLQDRHHLMCFIVDPFNWVWCSRFHLQTNMAELVTEMIELFVPLDADKSSKARDIVRADFMVSSFILYAFLRWLHTYTYTFTLHY
jgi:hypothetical protein